MKKRNLIFVAILVLLLAVGFAAVSTSLIIGNNTTIGTNPDDFNVYFISATTDEGSTAVISQDGKSINFTTRKLSEVGDSVELEYYIFNASTNYDAYISLDIDVNSVANNVDYSDYFTISRDGIGTSYDYVGALYHGNGSITITLDNAVLEDVQLTYTVTLNVTASEREDFAVRRPDNMFILSGNGKTVGDEISLYDEHFYLLSKEGTKLNYISKYLLNVGSYTEPGTIGIQNSGCNGGRKCFNAIDTRYYLDSNQNYLPKYTANSSLPYYIYDENNTDYEYVEAYANMLSIKCNIDITGRLVNYNDISWFENGVVLHGGKGQVDMPSWFNVNGDRFKLGISGEDYDNSKLIWSVNESMMTYYNNGSGVKPVISFDESVLDNLEM